MPSKLKNRGFESEIAYQTSRSSGKGGQNVNKVETRVELGFDVVHSSILTEEEKKLILSRLKNKISKKGMLKLASESKRTQLGNKKAVTEKFYAMLQHALKKPKKRKPTRPSKAAKEKRLKQKKIQSEKKERRRM